MERIYLDYAATTPVDPRVVRAIMPYFTEKFGNPSSIHSFGQEALFALDMAREKIAHAIGADFRELIFTGSATEANNLVLRGVIAEIKRRGIQVVRPRIITSAIEHESVLETCRALRSFSEEVEVVYLPVDKNGVVNLKEFQKALTPNTVLVSTMYANNEIGTIQPLAEIAKIIRNFKSTKHEARNSKQFQNIKSKIQNKSVSDFGFRTSDFPLFHTDAVQALQFLECNVRELGLDFMTFSAHKLYGPKGVGALYAKSQSANSKSQIASVPFLAPQILGGSQEFALRSGTQNAPLIVGFTKAIELVTESRDKEARRIAKVRDALWRGIHKIQPKAALNNSLRNSLPNILNVYFPKRDAHELVIQFDLAGIAISAGSACGTRMLKTSHVLKALSLSAERAKSSVRFSLGRQTTSGEIKEVLRRVRPLFRAK